MENSHSCSQPQPATDNVVRDGRSNWLVAPPTLMGVPPERLVHIIYQCNLGENRTCNRSMRGNHLALKIMNSSSNLPCTKKMLIFVWQQLSLRTECPLSQSPLLSLSTALTLHCSHSPLLPLYTAPTLYCSLSPLLPLSTALTLHCSHSPMFPLSTAPTPHCPTLHCSHSPLLPLSTAPTPHCSHSPLPTLSTAHTLPCSLSPLLPLFTGHTLHSSDSPLLTHSIAHTLPVHNALLTLFHAHILNCSHSPCSHSPQHLSLSTLPLQNSHQIKPIEKPKQNCRRTNGICGIRNSNKIEDEKGPKYFSFKFSTRVTDGIAVYIFYRVTVVSQRVMSSQ